MVAPRLLDPKTSAAVLLGASDWAKAGLGMAPSFRRSEKRFLSYLIDETGLGLDSELVLDLFDDPTSAGEQLARIRDFLDRHLRERRDAGEPVADVIIYYIGHGSTDEQAHLALLVRRSHRGLEAETGIRAPDLARVLRVSAPQQRRLVVLDCCFAEAAVRAFVGMSAPDQALASAAAKDIAEAMPSRGGLLLCSSQMTEIAVGAPSSNMTLFTSAMLHVLRNGVNNNAPFLSFAELCDTAYNYMVNEFGANAPRPVLHPINQAQGDLTRFPAFPNFKGRATSPNTQRVRSDTKISDALDKTSAEELSENPQTARRLQLISRWFAQEVIPIDNLELIVSIALDERSDRTAILIRRVLDSPNARANALMAALLGAEEGMLSRKTSSPVDESTGQGANQASNDYAGTQQPSATPVEFDELFDELFSPEAGHEKSDRARRLARVLAQKPGMAITTAKETDPNIQILGKYELRGTLGRGAMGIVYDGWDPLLTRRVAIKAVRLPKDSEPETEEEIARFRREAQAAGRLTHPNIVAIYDYGETSELAYIAMEFVEGTTLKYLLDRGERFAIADIARIMQDVLSGLEYSHARGVVHRDIKPANVMLTSTRQAKIADFGIARIESSSMTQAGTVLGTPAYMSPEQFMGQVVDRRTDIYSAGVLLYQLLTGERPFEGSVTAIMHKVLNIDPRAPSELVATVPPTLDAVVRRAMAKQPEDRYPSAIALAEAMRRAIAAAAPEDEEDSTPGGGKRMASPHAPLKPRLASQPSAREAPRLTPAARHSRAALLIGIGAAATIGAIAFAPAVIWGIDQLKFLLSAITK